MLKRIFVGIILVLLSAPSPFSIRAQQGTPYQQLEQTNARLKIEVEKLIWDQAYLTAVNQVLPQNFDIVPDRITKSMTMPSKLFEGVNIIYDLADGKYEEAFKNSGKLATNYLIGDAAFLFLSLIEAQTIAINAILDNEIAEIYQKSNYLFVLDEINQLAVDGYANLDPYVPSVLLPIGHELKAVMEKKEARVYSDWMGSSSDREMEIDHLLNATGGLYVAYRQLFYNKYKGTRPLDHETLFTEYLYVIAEDQRSFFVQTYGKTIKKIHRMEMEKQFYEVLIEADRLAGELRDSDPGMSADEIFEEGLNLYKEKRYEPALEKFMIVTEIDPNYLEAWHQAGNCAFNMQDYNKALEYHQKYWFKGGDESKGSYSLGATYYALKDYKLAAEYFGNMIQADPNGSVGYQWRAESLYALGQKEDACPDYRKALELGLNGDAGFHSRMNAACGSLSGDPEQLLAEGKRLHEAKQYAEAVQKFNSCIAQRPKWAAAYLERGLSRGAIDPDDPGVLADHLKAVELEPDNAEARFMLGAVYQEKGRYDEAIVQYKEYGRLLPDMPMSLILGHVYRDKGDYVMAILEYDKGLEKRKSAYLYRWRGHANFKLGNYEAACADLGEARRLKVKEDDEFRSEIEEACSQGETLSEPGLTEGRKAVKKYYNPELYGGCDNLKEEGFVVTDCTGENGRELWDGPYKSYWECNGNLVCEGTFRCSKEVGVWKRYNRSGEHISTDYFNDEGKYLRTEYK